MWDNGVPKYLIDTNVFIEAQRLHYGLDFCPAFWIWLEQKYRAGIVASIAAVRDELLAKDDKLAAWVWERDVGFFSERG